jgi:hypothetical protein
MKLRQLVGAALACAALLAAVPALAFAWPDSLSGGAHPASNPFTLRR